MKYLFQGFGRLILTVIVSVMMPHLTVILVRNLSQLYVCFLKIKKKKKFILMCCVAAVSHVSNMCFTEEEISNMRSELEKYGIQMPAFSKIGGILANELSVDEAACE